MLSLYTTLLFSSACWSNLFLALASCIIPALLAWWAAKSYFSKHWGSRVDEAHTELSTYRSKHSESENKYMRLRSDYDTLVSTKPKEVEVIKTVEKIVEKRVEVPVDRIVEKIVEKRVEVPIEKIVEKRVEVPVEKIVEKRVEVPVEKIVEKRVEVPVDRIVEKRVEVPVEKIVEKRVEVPVDRIVEKRVEVPVEKIVEKRVEVPVDRIVEKRVEVPVEKIVEKRVEVPVDRIVEKRVEVPVEKIVEKRVEVPVEKIVEKRVEVPVEKIVEKRVEVPVEKIVEKRVEVPVDRIVEKRVEVPVDRIVEKRVEVPVDRIVEKIVYRDKIVQAPASNVGRIFYCVKKNWKWDDLKIVEGIGPVIEKLLHKEGIKTWKALATTKVAVLNNILEKGGDKFNMHDPATWPEQARLADQGNCPALTKLQDKLNARKPVAKKTKPVVATPTTFDCLGKKWKWDDLKIVEGIGPVIEKLLHKNGIKTWKALAQAKVSTLKAILSKGGDKFNMHDPATWPEQARLAQEGNCPVLTKLQERLNAGKPASKTKKAAKPKVSAVDLQKQTSELSLKYYGKKVKRDDHTIVEGIGPVIDKLLRTNKILTWNQLSNTSPKRLKEILDTGGSKFQMHDPSTWPAQAALADQNKWKELKTMQDKLDKGRK